MKASEIMEGLVAVQNQARALLGQTNALIRMVAPLVEAEEQEQEQEGPRTFGGKKNG